jgi:SAM-dependent methyltransferase
MMSLFKKRFFKNQSANHNTSALPECLSDWFDSNLGQSVIKDEQQALESVSHQFFGSFFVQLSAAKPTALMKAQRLYRHLYISMAMDATKGLQSIRADIEHLPLVNEGVDVMVLHHALEFSSDPQQLLREVQRAMAPGGKLVIFGFNPNSFWGLAALFNHFSDKPPWMGHFVRKSRLTDWLKLLGYDVGVCKSMGFTFPSEKAWVKKYFGWFFWLMSKYLPFLGGSYMLMAVKRSLNVMPNPSLLARVAKPIRSMPKVPSSLNTEPKNKNNNTKRDLGGDSPSSEE